MAVDPSGQTLPPPYFYDRGHSYGRQAAGQGLSRTFVEDAMRQMAEFQDPSFKATAADKSSFKAGFTDGYNMIYSQGAKDPDYGAEYVKRLAAEEKRVAGLKTVEQWENEVNIPSWGVADSVASRFGADVEEFESLVQSKPVAASPAGLAFAAKMTSFHDTAKNVCKAVLAKGYPSPSSAVAEIRKGRTALNALIKEYKSLSGGESARTQTPPPSVKIQPPAAKIEAPAPKEPFPMWVILAALGGVGLLGVGGYFMFFYEKKGKKKPMAALPPPKAPMMESEEFVAVER